jgi:hypothetical protein
MFKKIYSYFFIIGASLCTLVSCDEDEEKIEQYSANVLVNNSSLAADEFKYNTEVLFSIDGGETFGNPVIKLGQKYLAKIILHRADSIQSIDTEVNCFDVDWSASTPAPTSGATSNVAEFTMKESNEIIANVTEHETFDAAVWNAATYTALEDYGSSGTYGPYNVILTEDSDPETTNRFYFDNFYDQGLSAYVEFDPETRSISFPDQTAGGKPLTGSAGVFNQCTGEIRLSLHYDGADWHYILVKQ